MKQEIQSRRLIVFVFVATLLFLASSLCAQSTAPKKDTTSKPPTTAEKSKKNATLASQAKITMDQARQIALKQASGPVVSSELEKEKGKLIYSFDIKTSEKEITEVNVDAITGKVVGVEKEDAAKEAEEAKREAKAKSKTAPKK